MPRVGLRTPSVSPYSSLCSSNCDLISSHEENGGMPSVTISGGAGEVVSLPFNSGLNALYAQTLADEASQAVSNGTLRVVDYTGGMLPPPVAGIEDEVGINAAAPLTLPPEATVVVNAASPAVLFGGGAPDETVLSGNGDLTFFTDGGSGNIVTGDGNNHIVQSGAGPCYIATGAGNNQIEIAGGTNTVSAGTGSNTILLSDGNNLVSS